MLARFFLIALLGLVARTARADDVALALTYDAPAECPDAVHFQDEVSARLGRNAFTPSGESITVAVTRESADFRGVIQRAGLERTFRDADCALLVRDLATALAVQLDAPVPVAASTPAPDSAPKLKVEVSAKQANLSLFSTRQTHVSFGPPGSQATVVHEQFAELCAVPCTLELAPDSYHFAVSQGLAAPLSVPAAMRVDQPVRLEVGYRSNARVRKAGAVLATIGIFVGGGLALGGALYDANSPNPHINMPLVGTGCGLLGIGLIVGPVLLSRRDRAFLRILGL